MDMRQLEYFLTLCEQEHMSSTAARLGISQPGIEQKHRQPGERRSVFSSSTGMATIFA